MLKEGQNYATSGQLLLSSLLKYSHVIACRGLYHWNMSSEHESLILASTFVMTKSNRGHKCTLYYHLSVTASRTETLNTTHTNSVLEPFELILISYQTTTCPYEEMEATVTDMLKMPYRSVQFKSLSAV